MAYLARDITHGLTYRDIPKLYSADEPSFFLHRIISQAPWSYWNSQPGIFLCRRLWDNGLKAHPNQNHRSPGYGHSRTHYFAVPFWPNDSSLHDWKSDYHHWQFLQQTRRIQPCKNWHSLFPPFSLHCAQVYLWDTFIPRWRAYRRTSFFITPIFHQLISCHNFPNWPRAVSYT